MKTGNPIEEIHHELELDEKINTHKKAWQLQRLALVIMFLTVLAALLGLCGNGPLSYRTQAANSDTLEYEYFLRYQGTAHLRLRLQQQPGLTRIGLPLQYWKHFKVDQIIPEPSESRMERDSLFYFFPGVEKGFIQFYLAPEVRGSLRGGVRVNDHVFPIAHFIYP